MKMVRGYPNGLHVLARIVSSMNFSDSLRNIFVPDLSKHFSHTTGRWAEAQTGTDLNHLCLPTLPPKAQIPIVQIFRYADFYGARSAVSGKPRFGGESIKVSARFLNWSRKLWEVRHET